MEKFPFLKKFMPIKKEKFENFDSLDRSLKTLFRKSPSCLQIILILYTVLCSTFSRLQTHIATPVDTFIRVYALFELK
jgi:energy-converting hydrogenase Eha subunit G